MVEHEDKTTVRQKRDGTHEHKTSFWTFPQELHQKIKDRSCKGESVGGFYSEAISIMRRDFDAGTEISLLKVPNYGRGIQVWITENANKDMRYLSERLYGDLTSVVYTAITRFFENERSLYGVFREDT